MNHLTEERLTELALSPAARTDADEHHLLGCPNCRETLTAVRRLLDDLALAQQATPAPATLARYDALFDEVQQMPSLLSRAWQSLKATLTWDSRLQTAPTGVRSVAAQSYRLLFTVATTEIELLVVDAGRTRLLEGELVASEGELGDALVELIDATGQVSATTVSRDGGRFHVADLLPGHYQLLVTPVEGSTLLVDNLDLS